MKPRVTQKDVAVKAGVSHVSVSLALRGHHSIPPETRERIKRIARQLGYVPDPMLSGLSAYRLSRRPTAYQSNIGWLNCWSIPKELQENTDFGEYYAAAVERARELGYSVEEIRLVDVNNDVARLEKILRARGINGLLLPPAQNPGFELRMDYSRFSVVRFGYSFRHPVLHTVANAQFRTVLVTVQKLVALGYKRIGLFLTHDQDERTGWNFIGGFAAGQQLLQKSNRVAPFYYTRGDIDRLANWIKRSRIDVAIGLSGWEEVRETGATIGYADLSIRQGDGYVSGMYQNCRRIGVTAVDFLTGMMLRTETGIPASPTHLFVESIWSPGKTAISGLNKKVTSSR